MEGSRPGTLRVVIALPHLKVGGAERTASELANYLVSRGEDVTILLMYKRERFFPLDPRVSVIEPQWTVSPWGKFINVIRILFHLRASIRKCHPDVVLAIGYMALTLFASLGIRTRVVLSGRSSPSRVRFPGNPLLHGIYLLSHSALSGRVNGIIAQTIRAAEMYRKKYNCPIMVIPNFLRPIQSYSMACNNWIITVGRCDAEKGHGYLLQAFARLNAPSWELVIVGDGPLRSSLESKAVELGIRSRVQFTGFRKDVDYFLSQSKIFAFTSLHEGFPNALLEAMATPLACVSFDCVAGPSDIIKDSENGFLVPVGDIDKLTSKLQQLIDDESLRLTVAQNAGVAKKEYAIEKVGERYREFLYDIVNLRNQ